MPASSDQDDGSPQENGHVHVKAEKIKAEGGRRATRATPEPQHEEPAEEEQEQDGQGEDEDEEEDDDENDEGDSTRGSKRRRANEDGDVSPKEEKKYGTQPRDTDGFIPGSIVRIQLYNFVTYDYVEFTILMPLPPNGANGTGKSTAACAICLGLNFPPSLLGRANELSAFVKIGKKDGYTEIELKGPKGRKNLVIRRGISSTSKTSTFHLNGKSSSGKEVTAKVAELGVQVGNLCSFLPQDRVSEFAQMSSQELLKQTQHAAGDQRLASWHESLISAGKEKAIIDKSLASDKAQLTTLTERNALLEREVKQVKERQALEIEIAIFEVLIPIKKYYRAHEEHQEKRAEQRIAHGKANALKEKNEPAHALNEKLQKDFERMDQARLKKKDVTKRKMGELGKKIKDAEKMTVAIEKLDDDLQAIKRTEKARALKIKETKKKIQKMQDELENPPEVEDPGPLNNEHNRLNQELAGLRSERKDVLGVRVQTNYNDQAKEKATIAREQNSLHQLASKDNQKFGALHGADPITAAAVVWLRNNKHLFQMEVFEPPVISVNIPDVRFHDSVESCFGFNQKLMLVAQCEEDYRVLNHHLNDTDALKGQFPGQTIRVNTWYRSPGAIGPPPMSREQMAGLGFDGYALDYIECPEGLKYFLQKELQLHRTAIGLNASRVNVGQAMAAVSQTGGANFIAGNTTNSVSRSKYGTRAAQNSSRQIGRAKLLVAPTMDQEAKARCEEAIKQGEMNLDMLKDAEDVFQEQSRKTDADMNQLKKDMDTIKQRLRVISESEARIAKVKMQLEAHERVLHEQENAPTADQESANIKQQLRNMNKKRVRLVKEYVTLVASVVADQVDATVAGLQYQQTGANLTALCRLCDEKDKEFQAAMAAHDLLWTEVDKLKDIVTRASKASTDAIGNVREDVRETVAAVTTPHAAWEKAKAAAKKAGRPEPIPGEEVDMRNLDELQQELDEKNGELEQAKAANPGVIAMYERRVIEIAQLEDKIKERDARANRIQSEIDNAEKHWKPALYKLVKSIGKKFSASFDRIGCAGEIQVREDEDYDKWAIEILVKFRDKEKLQILTAQRQSGGERSLTTILYLMSLSEEARAPFSLVDEINQGMDARAERAVHDSMVKTTCKVDAAQYFLITPKLLPDLTYDRRMKILCVNNGEWIPEEKGLGNMNDMLDVYVSRKTTS